MVVLQSTPGILQQGQGPSRSFDPAQCGVSSVAVFFFAYALSKNLLMEECAPGAVWFCVRRDGRAGLRGWTGPVALTELPRLLSMGPEDQLEVCVVDAVQRVSPKRRSKVFTNRMRGILGVEVSIGSNSVSYAPTDLIATNRSFSRVIEDCLERRHISEAEFRVMGSLQALSCRQFLVPGDGGAPIELVRGSEPVAPTPSLSGARASALADGIGKWMLGNLSADGELPYKYWPSRGTRSPADNAIRRLLAALALARLGRLRGDARIDRAARRNLGHILKRYFRGIGDGKGAIVEGRGAKLGAAALAALAILESPSPEEFRSEYRMLAAGVASMTDPNHGFRTFFFPAERDGENWNFYSGEALLFWAEARRRGAPDAPSLAQCMAAFERCRRRHRRARNPAFVPWHTQACASLFAQTGRRELAQLVFEVNDWLLPMQQWDEVAADLRGRFYNPKRPDFGPPHAASTGAYVEGLADAAALARAVGDTARAAAYEQAVNRGLRSLRQLQFRNARDSFYVSRKRRVLGALRTEAYDNAVRIDSVAHALAAAIKILKPMKFDPVMG